MPLYDYQCSCGFKFDAFSPIEKRFEVYCPSCGRLAIKKLSLFNFTFGFRLSDESMNVKGARDYFVRDI